LVRVKGQVGLEPKVLGLGKDQKFWSFSKIKVFDEKF